MLYEVSAAELSPKDIHKLKTIVDKLSVSEQLNSAERVMINRFENPCRIIPYLSRSTCNELGIEFHGDIAQFIANVHESIKTKSFDFKLNEDSE